MINSSNSDVVKAIQSAERKQIATENQSRKYHLYCFSAVVLLIFLFLVIFIIRYSTITMEKRRTLDSANRKKDQTIERLHAEIDDDIRRKQEYETMAPLIIKFRNHPIYNKIINTIDQNTRCQNVQEKTLLSDAEWKEFQGQIDEIFPGFISRLKKLNHLLTDQDISFCCLVRLEFKYSDIASVFGCSPQAITKRKKRIFNQLGVDSTHAFEEILKNL